MLEHPIRKKFSRSLYNISDEAAKKIIREYLKNEGHLIVNEKENYYADIETIKDGKSFFHETEMKYSWKGKWPAHWEEIRIPSRKKRLLDKYKDEDLTFYVISSDRKNFWKIPANVVSSSEIREAGNKYLDRGETFYHISVNNAELY